MDLISKCGRSHASMAHSYATMLVEIWSARSRVESVSRELAKRVRDQHCMCIMHIVSGITHYHAGAR